MVRAATRRIPVGRPLSSLPVQLTVECGLHRGGSGGLPEWSRIGANGGFRSKVWKRSISIYLRPKNFAARPKKADIQDFLIFIEFPDGAIVGLPSHVFWLEFQIPFIRVKAAN